MADRPIIFSAAMVHALLAGRKTQTRRMLKLGARTPEYIGPAGCTDDPSCWGWSDDERGDYWLVTRGTGDRGCLDWSDWCGAYRPGDRLWVREAHAFDGPIVRYYATDDIHELRRKRPSIHMPRWASRLTLVVSDVCVQRLQEISEADAKAEGCADARSFGKLWDILNASRGFGWESNPWVSALTFSAAHQNIDQMEDQQCIGK